MKATSSVGIKPESITSSSTSQFRNNETGTFQYSQRTRVSRLLVGLEILDIVIDHLSTFPELENAKALQELLRKRYAEEEVLSTGN